MNLFSTINLLTILWQDGRGVFHRVWDDWINHKFTLGNVQVSATSVAIGIGILILTIAISRAVSSMLDRRLEKRKHIDPASVIRLPGC